MGESSQASNFKSDSKETVWHKRAELVIGIVVACLGAALGIGLVMLPPTSVRAIIFWLTIMFFLLAGSEILIARFLDFSRSKTLVGFAVPTILVLAFGYYAWPTLSPDKPARDDSGIAASSKPDLKGSIDFVSVGTSPENQGSSAIIVVASIRNLGTPSIAENYSLEVIRGKDTLTTQSIAIPETLELGRANKSGMVFHGNDALYDKTKDPIATNTKVPGVLMFLLPNVDAETLNRSNFTLRLSWADIAGKPYTVERGFSAGENSEPVYIPGIKSSVSSPKTMPK